MTLNKMRKITNANLKKFVCIDDLPHNRTLLQGDVETNVGVDLLRFLGTARISRKTLEI